ncbi:hemerythrin domain-containing protein [Blastococcus sp. TF02A-35]|uniref:hemerythrin domain-containing protein n=1 Tax=Blastococcus sp. TF02A-35 TaxID=2559612 RepID=UPI001073AC3D|nr:hemerythrin domain-containing protein [Blastococcus sp. TF02A_35]TFV47785.1 hemerythrin domain-containing protein [Blastococcus sp. TF02A_35]
MTATALRAALPRPRRPVDDAPAPGRSGRASAYQRVLHQLVRRELRTLADVATWAPDGECARTGTLTCHAGLVARVLLHHHAVEREAVWPALLRAVPAPDRDDAVAAVGAWAAACSRIDARLRDLETTARQWAVAGTGPARDAFARACHVLADDVGVQTADEEAYLLPLLDAHLPDAEWSAISRTARCGLSARQRLIVVGLAMEDCCAGDRARLLGGLPRSQQLAWRLYGGSRYRAAVVRLRRPAGGLSGQ